MFDGDPATLGKSGGDYAGKTLYERATGRFYTPDELAVGLAQQMLRGLGPLPRRVSVCDPFCGDGRLVAAILGVIADANPNSQVDVTLLDLELAAVELAAQRVSTVAKERALTVTIRKQVGDSFAAQSVGAFDAVITNPPWELLKPDSRETAGLSDEGKSAYRAWLAKRCEELDTKFPEARADVSWAGWGTNLARCGWALALRSCRAGGVLGIVLPGTLMGDQASGSMRRHALCNSELLDIAAYPPEARLFAKVDQPVVAATFRACAPAPGCRATLRLYAADRTVSYVTSLGTSENELSSSAFAIPVGFGATAREVISRLSHLGTFGALEGSGGQQLWAGRELDETRVVEKLEGGNRHPFIKGRMIKRFTITEKPTRSVKPGVAASCYSSRYVRLAWRDVARASQRRRMITCTIPQGWVAGNSLHVAHFRDGDARRLQALLAITSSFVFEFLVRARLTTGHMSLGVVRRANVPELTTETVSALSDAVQNVRGEDRDQASLEIAVAKAYGIDREVFEQIIRAFPKVLPREREQLLDIALWGGR